MEKPMEKPMENSALTGGILLPPDVKPEHTGRKELRAPSLLPT